MQKLAVCPLLAAVSLLLSPHPAVAAPTKDTNTYNEKGVQLIFTSDDPTFDRAEKDRLVKTFFAVYPRMTVTFNKEAPRSVGISIEKNLTGVAGTAGNVIHCSSTYFRDNPEDIDVITHEGMHVVQQYRPGGPGWLTEGLADYARARFGVNNEKANWSLPEYNAKQSYQDAYRVTARFLLWLERRVKPGIAVTLDDSMRAGTYRSELWKDLTGKTVDELWQDYGKNPALTAAETTPDTEAWNQLMQRFTASVVLVKGEEQIKLFKTTSALISEFIAAYPKSTHLAEAKYQRAAMELNSLRVTDVAAVEKDLREFLAESMGGDPAARDDAVFKLLRLKAEYGTPAEADQVLAAYEKQLPEKQEVETFGPVLMRKLASVNAEKAQKLQAEAEARRLRQAEDEEAKKLPVSPPQAGGGVTVERNDVSSASDDHRFRTILPPAPSAATGTVFKVVDGIADSSAGPLDVLRDGKGPDSMDEPAENFFFQDRSPGGRLLVDLGKVIPVQEIDTYSWHGDVRAPQVYQVYGSDGSGAFDPAPKRPQDPAQAGWKLIASVDTRVKYGNIGGQYAVKIADPAADLGNYRYLLFDVSQTEQGQQYGSTFYSEIGVIDRNAPARVAVAPRAPVNETDTYHEQGFELIFTNDDPDFDPKEKDRLVKTFFAVYPRMVAAFNKEASRTVTISIEKKCLAVAGTGGNHIHCRSSWLRRNPEDLDVVTHEGMHVVQAYRKGDPGWLMEGLADYARVKFGVNNQQAKWALPEYEANQSYTNAYKVTARFLLWLEQRVKPGITVALDEAMRAGTYRPELWKDLTGKSVDELWQDYGKNPAVTAPAPLS